ncbi:MAG: anti-sigma factor [Flavobacteriaceae bacterium]
MDKKKIIEEGLLERYILGTLSIEEENLLLEVLSTDEALKEHMQELEADFEQIGKENAIEPPANIKARLRTSLGEERTDSRSPASGSASTLQSGRLMVAASLAALFALGSFWLYVQWQRSLDDFNNLQVQTKQLQERLSGLERQYASTRERYTTINDPEAIPLYLVGNQKSPESRVTAYVNHKSKTVIVNSLGLVPLERERAYQMWADVEGEMINMGLLPDGQEYIPLRYIEKAESLNITVEPAGGSEHPTVQNLITNVYL